jgi:hypothetical protein
MPIRSKKSDPHLFKRIGQHQDLLYLTFSVLDVLDQHDYRENHHPQKVENMDSAQNIKKTPARQTPEIHSHHGKFPPSKKL